MQFNHFRTAQANVLHLNFYPALSSFFSPGRTLLISLAHTATLPFFTLYRISLRLLARS
jgi:hypothetical protein